MKGVGGSRPGRSWRLPILVTALITACLVPTDEGDGFGELRVRPTFEAGAEPEANGVTIDSIRAVVWRNESDEPLIDQVRRYNGPSDDLAWLIELHAASEDMDVELELRDGARTLYHGGRRVTVQRGALQQPIDDVAVTYTGTPVADRVEITPSRAVFSRVGTSTQLTGTVYDASGAAIDGYDLEWSAVDPSVAVVNSSGEVVSMGAGSTDIVATGGTAADTASVLVDVALATSTTITASPSSVMADGEATSLVTVEVRDEHGSLIGASAGTVTVTATPAGLGTLSSVTDHGDGTYTATLTAGTTAGMLTVTGTLDGADIDDSAEVELTAGDGDPTTTTISADPGSIAADGAATSEVTVEVRDANGNLIGESAGEVVLVAAPADLASLGPVTDHRDGTYTATLAAGTTAGTVTVTGTLDGAAIDDSAEVELTAGDGDPTTTTISADPSSVAADGAATSEVTVEVRDANGNLIGESDGEVALSLAPADLGTLGRVTDHGDGTYTATLTTGTTAGTVTVTGTLAGADIDDSAEVELNPGDGDASTTTITADPGSIAADGAATAEVTVEVRDANGNLIGKSAGEIALSLTPTDLGTLGPITDHGDGTYTAILTAGTTAGTITVTGMLDGDPIDDSAEVLLTGSPTEVAFATITADPTEVEANGGDPAIVTVRLYDENEEPITESGGEVLLVSTVGTLEPVVDHQDGTYTAELRSDEAGTAVITGTLNGDPIDDSAEVEFTDDLVDVTFATITADPIEVGANGGDPSIVTVRLYDENEEPVTESGGEVVLASTLGTLEPVTDHEDGTYTAELRSDVAGMALITGTLNGEPIDDSAEVEFTDDLVDVDFATITADPTEVEANGDHPSLIAVRLYDENEEPVTESGGEVVLASTVGMLEPVIDHDNGTYTAELRSDEAGTAVITGTLNGEPIDDSAEVEFTDDLVDVDFATITADPTEVEANSDDPSIITVRLYDENEEPITESGGEVVLVSTVGMLEPVIDHDNGTYTAELRSDEAGTAVITGTLNGDPIDDSAEVEFTDDLVDVAFATITADPTEVETNGDDPSIITVRLYDENEEPIMESGGAVLLASTLGTLEPVIDHRDGTYTAELRSDEAGTAVITGTLNGDPIDDKAEVEFTDDLVDVAFATITADPTEVETNGDDPSIITVRLYDENEEPLTESGGEVVLVSTVGTLEAVIDHQDGTYTAELRSAEAGTALITGTLTGDAIDDSAEVIFTGGSVEVAFATITADPTEVEANGDDPSIITVRLYDDNDEPVTESGGEVLLVATPADLASLGPVTDHEDGTYTATLTAGTTAGAVTVTGTLDGATIDDSAEVRLLDSDDFIEKGIETAVEGNEASNSGGFGGAVEEDAVFAASVGTVADVGGGSWSWSFATTDGPAESQVVTITRSSRQSVDRSTFDLVVENAAPTVDAGPDDTVASGTAYVLTGSFSDRGALDAPWSWVVDWGAGAPTRGSVLEPGEVVTQGDTFCAAGEYPVTLAVTDKDGGTGTDQMILTVEDREVRISIMPSESPNSVNLSRQGVLPVAVLSSPAFDASDLAPATVTLGGGVGVDTPVAERDDGRPHAGVEDVDGDGLPDLVLHFSVPSLVSNGDLTQTTRYLILQGVADDGCTHISGRDTVRIIP